MKKMNLKRAVLFAITLTLGHSVLAQSTSKKNILTCSASYANRFTQKWVSLDTAPGIEVPVQPQVNGKAVQKTQTKISFDNRGSSDKKLGFYVVVKAAVIDNSPLGEFASLEMDVQIPGIQLSMTETSPAADVNYETSGHLSKQYMLNSNGVAHLVSCDLKKQ